MQGIAICILTHNRPEAFKTTFTAWEKHLPKGAKLFVVDDASDPKYCDSDYRFEANVGIPTAKNKCLELAMDSGADHIFLSEDDCYPISAEWYKPYTESGINHLCFTFTGAYKYVPARRKPMQKDGFNIHTLPSGCMMYFTRHCIETVGGFDTRFGKGLYEHVDLTRRIYNACLTPYRFMDVIGSDKLFHSMDEHGEIERSFTIEDRKRLLNSGSRLFMSNGRASGFMPYK